MTSKLHFTVFEYQYRDAANFKAWGSILLTGAFPQAVVKKLVLCLVDECSFVAEQVGVPALYEELYVYSDGPTDDDHAYHEFLLVRPATREEISNLTPWGDVTKLVGAFLEAKNKWDITLSPHSDPYWWD